MFTKHCWTKVRFDKVIQYNIIPIINNTAKRKMLYIFSGTKIMHTNFMIKYFSNSSNIVKSI